MVSQENDNSVVFIGNVEAKQGKLTIRSDEMTVFYIEDKGGKDNKTTSQMDRLICKNNVKITQEDWLGTGDRMDYFARGARSSSPAMPRPGRAEHGLRQDHRLLSR